MCRASSQKASRGTFGVAERVRGADPRRINSYTLLGLIKLSRSWRTILGSSMVFMSIGGPGPHKDLTRKLLPFASSAVLLAACLPIPAQTPPDPAQPATTSPLHDIVGTWQGTLHFAAANRDLRIEDKISKGDNGELKVTEYSIEQGGQRLVATSASFEDGILKYSIDQGQYAGKMSADGKTIAGTWTKGRAALALNLERTNADTAWAIPEPLKSMPADANPGFDVATVKPTKPGEQRKQITFKGRTLITINTNMNDLLTVAYGLQTEQIIGAPKWFGTDFFDIEEVPDVGGKPSVNQIRTLLQKLLADRFKLAFHHEQRVLSVYVLTVARGGPKLKTTTTAPHALNGFLLRGIGDLQVRNMDMKEFSSGMQMVVMDKPVVDQTGLKDKYDFDLKWTPDDSQFAEYRGHGAPPRPPPTEDPKAPPSLYTAIQEQVGLKIVSRKAPADVIVVDHVEKSSAN
jgi:uncharacterized protein (TIGR03435 family)